MIFIICIYLLMNPSGNKFFDYILKAKEKKDKGKYAEALQLFHQAKNCFGGDEVFIE